jgi:hypothetical protein
MALKLNRAIGWGFGVVFRDGEPVMRISVLRKNSSRGYFPGSTSRARFIKWTESQPQKANGLPPQRGVLK